MSEKTFSDYLEEVTDRSLSYNESKQTEKMYDLVDDNRGRILTIVRNSDADESEIHSLGEKMKDFIDNFGEMDEDGIKYGFTRIFNDIDYFKSAYKLKNLTGIINDMAKVRG